MMKLKIKGSLSLKLLKPLLSTLLISCFIFLGNFSNGEACFSLNNSPLGNHFHFDLGENSINDLYSSNFKFLNHGNFLINNSENNFNGEYIALRFFQEGYSSFYSNYLIFWTSNGLYFADNMYNSSSSYDIQRQMYFPFLGIYDGLNGTVSFSISDTCGNNYIGHDLRNIDFPLSIFEADNLLYPDSVDLYLYPSQKSVCFRYSSLNKSACFWYINNYLVNNNLVSSLNPINFDSLSNIVGYSPLGSPSDGGGGGGFSWGGGYHFPVRNQSQILYDDLFNQGYRPELCYGGFALDNVFASASTSLNGIIVGSGASAFELHNAYSGGLAFSNWYDTAWLDYVYLSGFQDEYESEKYIGKSKGLIGLFLVRDSFFRDNIYNFSSQKLELFCHLALSDIVDTSCNTPDCYVSDKYSERILENILGGFDILTPFSGSALDFVLQDIVLNHGAFSGSKCMEFIDDSDAFRDCIYGSGGFFDAIDNSWKTWSIPGVKDNEPGILPWYIVFGFFGILLLYYLRR